MIRKKNNSNNKSLKAIMTAISAIIFGSPGPLLGLLGEDLLESIFSSSTNVISNILCNYSFEYIKEGSNKKYHENTNYDIERMIFEALAKAVRKLEGSSSVKEYKNEISRNINNNIINDSDDLARIEAFFKYWNDYAEADNISIETLDRYFHQFNMNLYDIDVVAHQQLEVTLQHLIFLDFDNLRYLHKFKAIIGELIIPEFKYESLQAIITDDKNTKARLAIQYQLASETKRIIQHLEQQQYNSTDDLAILKEGNSIVDEKLNRIISYINNYEDYLNILNKSIQESHNILISVEQQVRDIRYELQSIRHDMKLFINRINHNEYPIIQEVNSTLESVEILNQKPDLSAEEYERINENEMLSEKIIHNSKRKIKGEVFAIELLTRPIRISNQKREGRYVVTIDRRDVTNSIISTAAKTAICNEYVEKNKDKRSELIKLDQEIHQFLIGNSDKEEFLIDLPSLGIPLRWASGGVLSVVDIYKNDKHEKWTPFFFRDINPSGWNIALGASERQFDNNGNCIKPIDYELNKPSQFVYREFLEEMLVLEDAPTSSSSAKFKKFYFDDDLALEQQKVANLFAREHIDKRNYEEGLRIVKEENKTGGFGSNVIKVNYGFDTRTDLIVIDREGNEHFTGNVLITFNLLELGIEVIKVLTYSLDVRNYILDGEILIRKNGDSELVRMPCALISHKALKRIFSKGNFVPQYSDGIQPSFSPDSIKSGSSIKTNEFKMFDWDIKQRHTRMDSTNSQISLVEKERYRSSFQNFDYIFEHKKYLNGEIPTSFNPGTAKALSLYFARKEEK